MTLKTFTHVSASQIDTFLTCRRKWWLNKIMGLPTTQAASAALGEAVHNGQEKYLEGDGDETVVHPLAKRTLPLLRELRGKVFVERRMEHPLPCGIIFVGKIDVLDFQTKADEPRVIDWKTGNPTYFKTAEALRADIQMLPYAHEALTIQPAPAVRIAHYGIPTKGQGGGYVEAIVTADEVRAGWERINDLVVTMREVSHAQTFDQVDDNPLACMKYGRKCDFFDKCHALEALDPYKNLTRQENPKEITMPAMSFDTLVNVFGEPKNLRPNIDLFVGMVTRGEVTRDQLILVYGTENDIPPVIYTALKSAGTSTVAKPTVLPPEAPADPRAATTTPTPEPVTETEEATDEDKVRLLRQNGWSDDEINMLDDDAFALTVEKNWKKDEVEWDETLGEDGETVEWYTNVRKKRPARVSRTAPAETPASTEPRKRGRPPGAKNKATLEREAAEAAEKARQAQAAKVVVTGQTDVQVEEVELVPAEALAVAKEQVAVIKQAVVVEPPSYSLSESAMQKINADLAEKDRRIADLEVQIANASEAHIEAERNAGPAFTLLIDCLPEKPTTPFKMLEDVVAPFQKAVAADYVDEKTGEKRPLSHYSLVPYGQGINRVAAYLMANLDKIANGTIVVDSRSPCAAACIEVLRPVADVVIVARGR